MKDIRTQMAPPRLLSEERRAIPDLEGQIDDIRASIQKTLGLFCEALTDYVKAWMLEAAKLIAVQQDAHTVKIGRKQIKKIKETLRDHAKALRPAIEKEFLSPRYKELPDASTGQVRHLLLRRFDKGIKELLDTMKPVIEPFGYRLDEHWMERAPRVELPPDLREQIAKIADAITEIKVLETKITYYQRQRGKELAAELWDSV